MFRKYYILILSLFFFEEAFAQVNLVPNPSFEQIDSCPTSLNQIMYSSPWFQPFTDASGNPNSSSDLYSTCCTSFCGVPNNSIGNQVAKTGNSYAGIIFYAESSTREYIETILIDTLKSSTSYCIQFYISLGDNYKWAVSNIGAFFSNDSCLQVIPHIALPYMPQVENIDTIIVKDKNNWQGISLPYQALGGERFMTIGNFHDNINSFKILVGGTIPSAYYFIDDVSVIDISTPAYAGNDTTITIGDSIFIGRQPEIGLNDDCIWYVNGNPIDTVAGLWVMPDSTTTYILEQTICGYTTYDTVTVTVLPTNINELFKVNNLRIYPNPNDGTFTITHHQNTNNYVLEIIDVMGKTVHREILTKGNQQKIETKQLSSGIYFVKILNQQQQVSSHAKMSVVR